MIKKFIKGMLIFTLLYSCGHFLRKIIQQTMNHFEEQKCKYEINFFTLKEWIEANKNGKKATEYLVDSGISKISIYGAGTFADMLLEDIETTDEDIEVEYIVDAYTKQEYKGIKVVSPQDIRNCPEVDALIITPIYDYIKIAQELQTYNEDLRIISLENLILYLDH